MEYNKQEASLLGAVPGLHVSSSYWADPNQPVCEDANFSGNLRAGRGGVGAASNDVRIWIVAAAERLLELFPNPSLEGILFCPKIETLRGWALGRIAQGSVTPRCASCTIYLNVKKVSAVTESIRCMWFALLPAPRVR